MIKIIAEIGCNHKGNLSIAKEMIQISAKTCKADIVKFQKRNPRELLTEDVYNTPHPVPRHSYGETYGDHREFLEFSIDQHRELQKECEANDILYSASVWDMTSAQEIAALRPKLIKIPSATNQHFEIQSYLCKNYEGEIHVSVGMTTQDEIESMVKLYELHDRSKDLVIYACTSGYPVEFKDICLYEINRLQEKYGDRVKAIGFSGHHLGIAADIAAMTVGKLGERFYGKGTFRYIERHFTLDRTWKGTDHAASLEPDGLRRLIRDVRNIEKSLSFKETELLAIENEQRDKLKWLREEKTG